MSTQNNVADVYGGSIQFWALVLAGMAIVGFGFSSGIEELLRVWETKEEYSYGYMIPFITAFLIWQRKDILEQMEFRSSWAGVGLMILGLLVFLVGELSTLFLVIQYSLVLVILGAALSLMGWRAFKVILVPLLFLAFMIPLPQFFLQEISTRLQFLSSEIGVFVIRLFDISVFLEGNVIDLGVYKLQVVEACSGLRYLFPLMALSFMMAYFFNDKLWKRALIFLSSIPITVLMNSFRIGAIGVMVEFWGIEMAEGFLHDFEGWVIFMACMGVLLLEMWLLAKIGGGNRKLSAVFGIDMPAPTPKDARVQLRKIPASFLASSVIILLFVGANHFMPERAEVIPQRSTFASFPGQVGDWVGQSVPLEQIYLDELKLDDYLLNDYRKANQSINLYSAYYASQRKGQSAHSPRTCIPGGGWEIDQLTQVQIPQVQIAGVSLQVNRLLIKKGESTQLVYYWFQERGRMLTNEYLVKWFIFWDALTMSRTDGALLRLTIFVPPGGDIAKADEALVAFAKEIAPTLPEYVPGNQ